MNLEANYNDRKFVIEEDYPEIGVYLYVYENGKCICDYLQDDIDICIGIANDVLDTNKWIITTTY